MVKCPFCEYQQNLEGTSFCANCGAQFSTLEKRSIGSERLKILGGELRLLTACFVSLIGFERLIRKGAYSTTRVYIQEFLSDIEQIIKSFDGTSNHIIPDFRILAIFGAPHAHHDDSLRATRCAAKIKNLWFNKKQKQKFLHDVNIRIGIHTGRAFFGFVVEKSPFLTVIGDTINTASRLAEICPNNEILMSKNTYDTVSAYADVEHIGEQTVKGKTARVDVYRLKELKTISKISRAKKIPMFGRGAELRRLVDITQGLKDNKKMLCIVNGQMGIGKTRLKEEFEDYLAKDDSVDFIETHCTAEVPSPYFPFKLLLRSYFGINEFDSKETIAKKFDSIIAKKNLKPTDAKGIKNILLTDLRRLSSEEMRTVNEEIYAAIKNLLKYECKKKPLILIFEEFNKADINSKDLVTFLISEFENEPLMFLMINISREFITNMSVPVEEINLVPLSIENIEVLIKYILHDVDKNLIEFIYREAGGNPLFTIEAIRNARRNRIIKQVSGCWYLAKEQMLVFLDDLYGVAMSTIDSLPLEYRLIIDYASVIGYGFSFRILNTLLNRSDLKDQLNYLIDEGYIILSKNDEDSVYVFRHNLLKDAAYTVLPLRKRKEIHQQVANLFEQIYTNNLASFYEDIGHHYQSCDNFGKAANYFKLAGDKAKNLYAIDQAFSFYERVLNIQKDIGKQVPYYLVRDVKLNLTDLHEILGDIKKMEKIAREGLQDAVNEKDEEGQIIFSERDACALILQSQFEEAENLLLSSIKKSTNSMTEILTMLYSDLGFLYSHIYEYEKCLIHYNLSWNIARSNQIKEGEIRCLFNLAHLHKNLGNYEKALEYLQYSLDELIPQEDMRRSVQFKYLIADINHQIWNLKRAEEILLECFAIADSIGSYDTYIKSALALAVINATNQKFEEAAKYLDLVDKRISFLIRENLLAEINFKKAIVYYYKTDYVKANNFIINSLRAAKAFDQKEVEFYCYKLLSLIDKKKALDHAKSAVEIAELIKLPPLIADAYYRLTQILLECNDLEKARYYGKKALLVFDDLKSRLDEKNRQFYIDKPEYVKLLEV